MIHGSIASWQKYVRDELPEEVREMYEDHLYTCDQCLDTYMQAVTLCEAELPVVTEEQGLVEQVMFRLVGGQESSFVDEGAGVVRDPSEKHQLIDFLKETKKQQSFYESTIFHYFVAAAATFILMGSGVFSAMTQVTKELKAEEQAAHLSFTESMLDKTYTFMDEIDEKLKEEKNRR